MNAIDKAKENTLNAFNEMLDKQVSVKKGVFYTEAPVPGDDMPPAEPMGDEGLEGGAPEDEGLEKDALDTADEGLAKADIDKMSNSAKIELIDSIIDSLQQSTESDEEFSEHMNKIQEIIDGYKFEEEGEEGEEGGEEPEEMGGEEGGELPAPEGEPMPTKREEPIV